MNNTLQIKNMLTHNINPLALTAEDIQNIAAYHAKRPLSDDEINKVIAHVKKTVNWPSHIEQAINTLNIS